MSATRTLTNGYVGFFINCGSFAVSPYTYTFKAMAMDERGNYTDIAPAFLTVAILTFAVPILPALCSMTTALASVAVSLAVASMFILYPFALCIDTLDTLGEARGVNAPSF